MFVVATILYLLSFALCFIEDRLPRAVRVSALLLMAMVMIGMSTLKDIDTTADALTYVEYFTNNDDPLIELMTEPTFIYLSRLLIALGLGIEVLFFIYAVVAIPNKLAVITRLTPFAFTAMLIYVPAYYLLQDVIQIRAGAATSFLLVSLYLSCEKRHFWASLAFLAAILCHYSAIVYFPVLIWANRSLSLPLRLVLGSLVPIGFALYFMGMDLLSFLPSSLTEGKLDFYKESAETGDGWSSYTEPHKKIYLLAKCALLLICLLFYGTISERNKYVPSCLLMLAASIFVSITMARIPVIAGRVGDLYGITDAVSFTFCLYFIRPAWLVRVGIALLGLWVMWLYYNTGSFVV